jgi:DNA-binding IclR family transcriptional regulator
MNEQNLAGSQMAKRDGAVIAEPAAKEDGQRSIQSVELGFRLIGCLEEASAPMGLKDLSAAAGMAPSKAHLYLVSFRRVGLVLQESDSGRYSLGPYALQLGLSALRKLDVARLSRDVLRALAADTGAASHLTIWGNRGPCLVQRVDGPWPLPLSLQIGYVLPIVPTATGRVFLSYLPRATTAQLIAEERARTREDIDYSEATISRIIEETRAREIARTDGLLNIGWSALSSPIWSHDGSIAAAITIVGPSSGFDTSLTGRIAKRLRAAAHEVSTQMGWGTGTWSVTKLSP